MHTKTYITNFVPRTLDHQFNFPFLMTARNMVPMNRISHQRGRSIPHSTPKLRPYKPRFLKPLSVPIPETPEIAAEPPKFNDPNKILCVPDGSSLESKSLRFTQINLETIRRKYIGHSNPRRGDPGIRERLMERGMTDLIENVSESLGYKFQCIYTIDGTKLVDLDAISKNSGVLIFGVHHQFQGIIDDDY